MLCARCHGQDGRGNPEIREQEGLDLTASVMVRSGDFAAARQRIVDGKGTMPAFGRKLTAEQLDMLAHHALTFAPRAEPPEAEAPQVTDQAGGATADAGAMQGDEPPP